MNIDTVGIIGLGNMGEAIARGLHSCGRSGVYGCDTDSARAGRLQRRYKLRVVALGQIAALCDTVIVAVKPQDMPPLLTTLAAAVRKKTLVISVAAGLPTVALQKFFSGPQPVARVMPNLPALVGAGVSAYCCGAHVSPRLARRVRVLFKPLGAVYAVDEAVMDAITALTGSGPGFWAYILQGFIQAAMAAGLPPAQAAEMCLATMAGTAALLGVQQLAPQELVARVASKGGTTAAGLEVLAAADIAAVLKKTIDAAVSRAAELSRDYSWKKL